MYIRNISEFIDLILSKHDRNLSSVIIIVESCNSINFIQNAFPNSLILPSIYSFDTIPNDDLNYFKIPKILPFNASVISFSEYLMDKSDIQNWGKAINLSRYLISLLCFFHKNNIKLNDIINFIDLSPYKKSLYKEFPFDLLSLWKKSSNFLLPFEVSDYAYDLIIKKISNNKHIYLFDIDEKKVSSISDLFNKLGISDNLNVIKYLDQSKEEINAVKFPYHEFSNFYQQASFIANEINNCLLKNQKVTVVGLDKKLYKILSYELGNRSIDFQQKVPFSKLNKQFILNDDLDGYINLSEPQKILDDFWDILSLDLQGTSFLDRRNIVNIPDDVAKYIVDENSINIGNKNASVSFIRDISELYPNEYDVIIFICQKNFVDCFDDPLGILDKNSHNLSLEERFFQYSSLAKIVLTYSSSGSVYPAFLSKLDILGYLDKSSQDGQFRKVEANNCVCSKKQDNSFVISYFPKTLSLSIMNNLANNPYRFFVNDYLKLKPSKVTDFFSFELGNIFHKAIEEFIIGGSDLLELVVKNIKQSSISFNFMQGIKYEKLYLPFIKLICKQMGEFIRDSFSRSNKMMLEKDLIYQSKNKTLIKFRCDGVLFDEDKINVLEYKLSTQSLSAFKFQIIMQLYMLYELIKSDDKQIVNYIKTENIDDLNLVGNCIKIAPKNRFKTYKCYLFNNGDFSKDVEKVLDLFFDILDKNNHIIKPNNNDYKHFSRNLG